MRRPVFAAGLITAVTLSGTAVQAAEEETTTTSELQEVTVHGNYIANGTSSAMKLDVPVRDTPFSVTAYTESFMQATETTNVSDLYKYMTGIQRAGATAFDMSIRGFKTSSTDRNAIMVDGLPGLAGRFASPPTVSTDHVEVVRGPASVLYGQAQPGGFVNIIPKKPSAVRSEELELKGTAYQGDGLGPNDAHGYDYSLDATGPIDSGGRLLYRVIGEEHDTDGFRDFTYSRGPYIAPSLTWNIGDRTSVTLMLELRETQTPYDRGLVVPQRNINLVAPITTYYQQPSDVQKERGTSEMLELSHELSNGIKFRLSGRNVDSMDQNYGFDNVAVRPDLLHVSRRATTLINTRTSRFWDANAVLPFSTGWIGHQMIVGVNGGEDTAEANRVRWFTGAAKGPLSLDIALYDPVYTNTPPLDSLPLGNTPTPNPDPRTDRLTDSHALGAYIADLMTLAEHWKLNLGLRSAYEGQKITDRRLTAFGELDKTARKVLPFAGLLYQPTTELTFYTSYSTSFVPATPVAIDINGNNPFVPESSWQTELGVKSDLFDGKLQTTLAGYKIKKDNTLSTFSCGFGLCYEQIGSERSQGVELELDAQPVRNWQIAAGASRQSPIVVTSLDPVQVGAQLQNAARDNYHLWTRYDVDSGLFSGWGAGAGVSYIGARAGNLPSTANPGVIHLPAFAVVDVGLYYEFKNVDLTLKAANLFDKRYFESTGATPDVQLQPGEPRNWTAAVRVRF
jgi:iron complex outermembrane receptor protein